MSCLNIQHKDPYLVIQMQNGRSNPINMALIRELREAIREARRDENIRGVLLTGQKGYFSVGLDVFELYGLDHAGITEYFSEYRGMVRDFLRFPKPLVAAVNGHCPAGACVIAICCDYRVMAMGPYRIGLNEIPSGLIVPRYIFEMYSYWIGKRKAYQYLMEGRLMSGDEAFEIGLVDELTEPDEVINQASEKLERYVDFHPSTWEQSKLNMRGHVIRAFDQDIDRVMEQTIHHWWSEQGRETMGEMVKKLAAKAH